MAISEYKKAVYDSLHTAEERKIIDRFYAMSNQDFQKTYRQNVGELVDRFDRTRLWPHQKENIKYRHDRLKKKTPPKGFITTLPAGAGKTEIFTQTILENVIEVTEDEKVKLITPPTVILVPSEDLITQTYKELKERAPNLMVGMDYGKKKDIQPLTITTYETFVAKVEEGKIRPGDVSLMVMDEAHRGLSDIRLNVFRRFLNNTLVDAYSASPAFDAMKNLYELLGKDSVIPGPNDRELTDMGFLAECHNVLLRVSIKLEDLPEALRNNPERYNDFLEELKIQAAKEFYLTYADEETGQRAFGKPAVGFTRYVRHAKRAAEVFDEALREHAANDKAAAKVMRGYTHPTQVLSRSIGDEAVDAAFNRILPKHKRTADEGENLITFTTKMAREGTNIPQWKIALGIQTPGSSVDQVQTRGRARRKTGDELSFVVDVFVEENGRIRGKPKFYYEAIDDPSIVRGVVTITPDQEQIEEIAGEVLEFRDKHEMKHLVLNGSGGAHKKYGAQFDKLWDKISAHALEQEKKKKPAPYLLDSESVAYKVITHYRDENGNGNGNGSAVRSKASPIKKTEVRISEKAIDQFRAALGMPGQINSRWYDAESLKKEVIGKIIDPEDYAIPPTYGALARSERAEYYEKDFNALLRKAQTHFVEQKSKASPKPFILGGEPLRVEERVDAEGNIIPAFHMSAVQAFRQALDVAPVQGLRFSNSQQFEDRVLEGVDPAQLKPKVADLWKRAEKEYHKHRAPGTRCMIEFGDGRVEAANCFVGSDPGCFHPHRTSDSEFEFCLDRSAIAIARRILGIAPITFDPDTIKWDKDIAAVEEITKKRDNEIYDEKTEEWMIRDEYAKHLGIAPNHKELNQLWTKIETAYLKDTENPTSIDSHVISCGKKQLHNWASFCVHIDESPWFREKLGIAEVKTDEWKSKTEYAKDVLGIRLDKKEFSDLWDRIEKLYTKAPNKPVVVDGCMVSCGYRKSSAIQPFCVNVSEKEWFKTKLGLSEEKTDEWKTKVEFSKLLSIAPEHTEFNKLWNKIQEEYEMAPSKPTEIDGHELACGNKRSRGVHFCINESEANWFRQTLKLASQNKTPEWKNKTEFAKLIGAGIMTPRFDRLWCEIESACSEDRMKAPIINRHNVKCTFVKSGPKTPFCIHESEGDWFRQQMDVSKDGDAKIWRNSDHVRKRTGRSRSTGDE